MRLARPLASALGLLLLAGCGDGCVCTNIAKSVTKEPPADQVQAEIARQLANDGDAATRLCGVEVTGLADVVVEIEEGRIGARHAKVRGRPVLSDGGGAPTDASASTDAGATHADAAAKLTEAHRDAGARHAAGSDGGAGPDGGAEIVVALRDPRALALCAGVVSILPIAVYASDGTVKEWTFKEIEVESVSTPGVKFDKAGTSGGGRRRHHHHHH